jgi:hypothetical protein
VVFQVVSLQEAKRSENDIDSSSVSEVMMQNTKTFSLVVRNLTREAKGMKVVTIVVSILVVLFLVAWIGLNVTPALFPAYPQSTGTVETISLPHHLPAPVERFYRKVYGDTLPVISSAVVTGRATMRIMGLTLPARFRFTHEAGQNYRHYIEATFFGFPFFQVNETYLDGNSRLELPFGVTEHEPKVNQAANLGLWSETIWFPAYFLMDPRVRWEPVDDVTALLVVPFENALPLENTQEHYVVRFDPDTGLIRFLESMRYKEANNNTKILWLNEVKEWNTVNGYLIPKVAALTWFDQGRPWAVFDVEEIVYNVDVKDYVRAKGL